MGNKDAPEFPGPGDYEAVDKNKIHYLSEGKGGAKPVINGRSRLFNSSEKGIIDQEDVAENLSYIGVIKKKEAIREAI